MTNAPPKSKRSRQLSQIHIAKKQLGLDDDTYRDLLWTVARVRSAKDLDLAGRSRVLEHMRSLGFKPTKKGRSTPARSREALAAKIVAQIKDQDLSDPYVDAIADRMFQIERWEWCDAKQLRKIVAALEYRSRRRASAETVA